MIKSYQSAAVLWLMLVAAAGALADYTFTTIDYPDVTYSTAHGISNAGHLVGEYRDAIGMYHGYLLYNDVYESFDYQPAVGTSGLAVNSQGDVAGVYGEISGVNVNTQAFRRVGGSYSELEPVPGSTYTQAGGINDSGHIVGSYYVNSIDRGFLFDGTTYTIGLNKPDALHTIPLGINNGGWIVGDYVASGQRQGFLLVGGNYTTINYPGKPYNVALSINDAGKIVGFYNDNSDPYHDAVAGINHGFIYDNGVYTTVDVPVAVSTQLRSINNAGQIAGFFTDSSGITHGFLATPPALTRISMAMALWMRPTTSCGARMAARSMNMTCGARTSATRPATA